jgi:hypothetical protein
MKTDNPRADYRLRIVTRKVPRHFLHIKFTAGEFDIKNNNITKGAARAVVLTPGTGN